MVSLMKCLVHMKDSAVRADRPCLDASVVVEIQQSLGSLQGSHNRRRRFRMSKFNDTLVSDGTWD